MELSPLEIVKLWNHPETFRNRLLKRSEVEITGATQTVKRIINDIKNRGDVAILDYTEKFDNVKLGRDQIQVSESEIKRAKNQLYPDKVETIEKAAEKIEKYHKNQLPEPWMKELQKGVSAGQTIRPLNPVGVYAPGGNAAYPSTVLMSVIPAKLAGVEKITLCTPPNSDKKINQATLVAADIAGADEIYKIGGAQAIVAMAYGTRTVPKVKKIVGPGNLHVAAAKKTVSKDVSIDFIAGPSEVLILADSTANPRYIALDLVAQAEHDSAAASVLVTSSEKLAEQVQEEIKSVLEDIPRERTAAKAMREHGHIVVVKSMKRAISFANDYAPEHLQIMTRNSEELVENIENAGAIFVGENSPTSAGDFAVGPSHVLPTGRMATKFAGLSVRDFVRMPSVQSLTEEGLDDISDIVIKLARMEGLSAHAKSVQERLED